ncbi:MAG TPA: 50S ribosomal protein L22 [Patescibacteria group bacterium]|nr:50S ribosomal protein L22 [Patescibacteria group bacterium]
MTEIISERRFTRTAPDKCRLSARMVRGKNIPQALAILQLSSLTASREIILAISSAAACAKEKDFIPEKLVVSQILVNEGPKLKRRRIIHQGRARNILKRGCHIKVFLKGEADPKVVNSMKEAKTKVKTKTPRKRAAKGTKDGS